jgi:hypothetical protein
LGKIDRNAAERADRIPAPTPPANGLRLHDSSGFFRLSIPIDDDCTAMHGVAYDGLQKPTKMV